MTIALPYGGPNASFPVEELVEHVRASGRGYIVVGGENRLLTDHTKPESLDYWLRTHFTHRPDTRQTATAVVDALVETGWFEVQRKPCPHSGRLCDALVLHAR